MRMRVPPLCFFSFFALLLSPKKETPQDENAAECGARGKRAECQQTLVHFPFEKLPYGIWGFAPNPTGGNHFPRSPSNGCQRLKGKVL